MGVPPVIIHFKRIIAYRPYIFGVNPIYGNPHMMSVFAVMWLKQCHKPSMTGNGNHTTSLCRNWGWFIVEFYQKSDINIPQADG